MHRHKHALAIGLVAATALVPGAAMARDDDDLRPGETVGTATVYAADGSASTRPATFGTRAFVDQLVRSGAAGGSFASDNVVDLRGREATGGATPAGTAEYDAPDGQHRFLSRSGFARPTTARYRRLHVEGTKQQALRVLTVRHFVNADGERVEERGYAVDVATGRMRKVSLAAAKALSLDPRAGRAGTEYVYQVHVRP